MRVALDSAASPRRWATLRPLTGEDEAALDPEAPEAGSWLLARLLGEGPLDALDVATRDRLLAALYTDCYGDEITARSACARCGVAFEFSFALTALQARLAKGRAATRANGPDADGRYCLPDGTRFRLPTVGDLRALADAPAAAPERILAARCIGATGTADADEADVPDDLGPLQEALEALAPVLSLDLEATCPDCGSRQDVPFDIERFFVDALAGERRYLTLEIHRLARAYRWPLADILRISRTDRRALVGQVEAEAASGAGSDW